MLIRSLMHGVAPRADDATWLRRRGQAANAARFRREADAAEIPAALWLATTRFTAAVRCGHSFVNPFNQGKALTSQLVERLRPPALPVPLARTGEWSSRVHWPTYPACDAGTEDHRVGR